jgi:hypothetical protein
MTDVFINAYPANWGSAQYSDFEPYDDAKSQRPHKQRTLRHSGQAETYHRIGTRYDGTGLNWPKRAAAIAALALGTLLTLGLIFISKEVRTFAKTVAVRGGYKERLYLWDGCPKKSDYQTGVHTLALEVTAGRWDRVPGGNRPLSLFDELLQCAKDHGSPFVQKLIQELPQEDQNELALMSRCLVAARRAQQLNHLDGAPDKLTEIATEIYRTCSQQNVLDTRFWEGLIELSSQPILQVYENLKSDPQQLFCWIFLRIAYLEVSQTFPVGYPTELPAIAAPTFGELTSFKREQLRDELLSGLDFYIEIPTFIPKTSILSCAVRASSADPRFGNTLLNALYDSYKRSCVVDKNRGVKLRAQLLEWMAAAPEACFHDYGNNSLIAKLMISKDWKLLAAFVNHCPEHAYRFITSQLEELRLFGFTNNRLQSVCACVLENARQQQLAEMMIDTASANLPEKLTDEEWAIACTLLYPFQQLVLIGPPDQPKKDTSSALLLCKVLNFLSLTADGRSLKRLESNRSAGKQQPLTPYSAACDLLETLLLASSPACHQSATHLVLLGATCFSATPKQHQGMSIWPTMPVSFYKEKLLEEHNVWGTFNAIATLLNDRTPRDISETPIGLLNGDLYAKVIRTLVEQQCPHLLSINPLVVGRALYEYLSTLGFTSDSLVKQILPLCNVAFSRQLN